MSHDFETRANYTIEEWLAIFKESEFPNHSTDEERISAFELIANEVLGMTNYANLPDNYWGFVFFETLRHLSRSGVDKLLDSHTFKIVKLDEFLKEEFTMMYLAMVHMEPFASCIEWGTSIRGAWIDYSNYNRQPITFKLDHCGLEFNEEQIFPTFKTQEELKVFFAALLIYYDNYLIEIGEDKYEQIKEMVYSGGYNRIEDLTMFYP